MSLPCRLGLHAWPRYVTAHTQAPAPVRCHRCRRPYAVPWHRFLDALLGPRCPSCGERVFPRDLPAHQTIDHAGDPLPRPTTTTERTPRP